MKYLNIQGENSMPNSHAFLVNKISENIQEPSFSKPKKINDWGSENPCNIPLDNTTLIFDYYKKMGYVTLYADDYEIEIFEFPNCEGFVNDFSHHTTRIRQFLVRNNLNNSRQVINEDKKNKCYLNGQDIFKYYGDFLKRYSNQPSASLIWQSNLIHDSIDNIFEQDEYLSEYFEKNSQYNKDSFIILMGDHGFRLGQYMDTDNGKYEHMNAYFLIKPPAELLGSQELIDNLKANSVKHISQLDVYATFLDILTEGPKNNFTNLRPYDLSNVVNITVKGSSLIRPLSDKNRSCYDMNIPFEYCLYQPKYAKLDRRQSGEIYKRLEEVFIKDINKQLEHGNLKEICSQLKIHNDVKDSFVVKTSKRNNTTLYEIMAIMKPGKGSFRAYYNQNFTLLSKITRTNTYKVQAELCADVTEYRKFCFCKSLVND